MALYSRGYVQMEISCALILSRMSLVLLDQMESYERTTFQNRL